MWWGARKKGARSAISPWIPRHSVKRLIRFKNLPFGTVGAQASTAMGFSLVGTGESRQPSTNNLHLAGQPGGRGLASLPQWRRGCHSCHAITRMVYRRELFRGIGIVDGRSKIRCWGRLSKAVDPVYLPSKGIYGSMEDNGLSLEKV